VCPSPLSKSTLIEAHRLDILNAPLRFLNIHLSGPTQQHQTNAHRPLLTIIQSRLSRNLWCFRRHESRVPPSPLTSHPATAHLTRRASLRNGATHPPVAGSNPAGARRGRLRFGARGSRFALVRRFEGCDPNRFTDVGFEVPLEGFARRTGRLRLRAWVSRRRRRLGRRGRCWGILRCLRLRRRPYLCLCLVGRRLGGLWRRRPLLAALE
jgi:hypothetical protein